MSGTVSRNGGAGPLLGPYVVTYEAPARPGPTTPSTNASGAYRLVLPAGNYKILIQPNTAGYTDFWYGGDQLANATVVVLTAPNTLNFTARAADNTAPVAVADSYSTPQNTALVQAAPGVLSNDTDADSNPLTAVLDTNVTHGALTLNANGGFTYTPTTGYSGPDSFTYHANDGTANSNIVTVSLTVNAAAGSLRGWWTMDGNANDSSGLANHASLIGSPTFVAGQVGQALSLNGTSQNASVPDDNSLDLTTGMTLAAWIRPRCGCHPGPHQEGHQRRDERLRALLGEPDQPRRAEGLRPAQPGDLGGHLQDQFDDHLSDERHAGCTSPPPMTGRRSSSTSTAPSEGSLAGPAAIATNTLPLGLGAQSDNTRWFTGLLDDARIYGTAP